jgi:uncharacterized protein with GYD domain
MSKYLVRGNYIGAGIAGLRNDGGTKRVAAAKAAIESVGGTLDCFYFAFGDTDIVAIADFAEEASAASASLLINSSGAVSITVIPLIDATVIDAASNLGGAYTPPGA